MTFFMHLLYVTLDKNVCRIMQCNVRSLPPSAGQKMALQQRKSDLKNVAMYKSIFCMVIKCMWILMLHTSCPLGIIKIY
uniref:Uncharacterized protein n=1 Tax=Anguilla anguilla TaxID=7936 RepID=A0A0E9XWK1_ANGAN